MRTVAVLLALLSVLPLFPMSLAADDCANPGAASFCQRIDAPRPSTPNGVPTPPDTPYWGSYYLWLGVGHCVTPLSSDCRGQPAYQPGVEPPTGGSPVGPGVFGVLYEESNGLAGLQRSFTSRVADRMVLV